MWSSAQSLSLGGGLVGCVGPDQDELSTRLGKRRAAGHIVASARGKVEQAAQGGGLRDDGHRNPDHALHRDGSRQLSIHAWIARPVFLHGNLRTRLHRHHRHCLSRAHVHMFAALVANVG